jgi:hypothetical protein
VTASRPTQQPHSLGRVVDLTPRLSATTVADARGSSGALRLHGTLDGHATRPLLALLRRLILATPDGERVVVDVGGVEVATAGGSAVLLLAQRLAGARRCALVVERDGQPVGADPLADLVSA